MKKLVSILISFCLLALAATPCFAAEQSETAAYESEIKQNEEKIMDLFDKRQELFFDDIINIDELN